VSRYSAAHLFLSCAELFAPQARGRDWELKVCLLRGAIQAIEAIRAACPHTRIVNLDWLCRVVAPFARPDLQREADEFNHGAVMTSIFLIRNPQSLQSSSVVSLLACVAATSQPLPRSTYVLLK